MWRWRQGRRRRQAERRVAVHLVTQAILEIRTYAAHGGPDNLTRVHQIADVVHNLPGGILCGSERRAEPYGYHTFRFMWETASPQQRDWLKVQCDAIGYDYSYLDQPPSPPAREEVRRSSSAKEITTATLASLDTNWAALEIRHADPDAMHVLMPREPNEPRFRPAEPGISEYNCLLRMLDGETILVHLRFPTGGFDALPARSRTRRWTKPARDGYLWRRAHAADGCLICTTRKAPPGQPG
jgi:hypothetical protein